MTRLEKIQLSAIDEVYYRARLTNGLNLYLLPKAEFTEISGLLSVKFGSIDSEFTSVGDQLTKYPVGLAHFLEHKLFELDNGKDASLAFVKLGAESNAFTGFEQTNYFFSAREQGLDSLRLLFEMLSNLSVTGQSIAREKEIIGQEIDMYADDSDYLLYSGTLHNLYPKTALGADIAGSRSSLAEIDYQELQTSYQSFYQTNNMSLIVVGQFDVEQIYKVVKDCQSLFSNSPSLPLPVKQSVAHPPVIVKRSIQVEDINKPKYSLGLRGLPFSSFSLLEQRLGLQLFFALLMGWTSKTYQKWYESGRVDDSFDIEIEVSSRFRFVMILLDTDQPIAMSNLLKTTLGQFEQSPDMTVRHLELVKREMYGDFMRSLDDIGHLTSQFVTYLTEDETYFDIPVCLEQLDLAKILAIGKEFLNQADMTDFTIFPK
ncbi:EF-P 5-aminopentanol modification-associated protein YfmH [Streptococcus cuniculipharyngis]|uniref:Insulinase family protein n=1 Tax=Streptococcus cuniculipharyngis TaxID=1562651 RepID=A0A5C5SDC7_9STRE|nr:pitrilysin family protein [Streptococcus cuniculipharyngis]TWS97686.1 insulinase family protein [Streptococcus cuniculipharyngis]